MAGTVRIGGASGFWGDSSVGAPQLVAHGAIDYLVFDYLAELTMSILAAARSKDPELGYATDFVTVTMKAVLRDVVAKGIRVISNAGGVNPQACARAIAALAAEQGIAVRIAVVEGDDVMPLVGQLRGQGVAELQSGAPLPDRLLTANAYLGALPMKQALDQGAQIVITGRCVDSAVTLGALMHEFGWSADDYDRLAQGSLAGHIIECGCQATGGLHTDWEAVPDWAHIGYPVIECSSDGSFVVTKPPGTGGLVNTAVISEQMLYEIGDPRRYLLPDVTCDFSQVTLAQLGEHRVGVRGARGLPPGPAYKVSATYVDGFRCSAQLTIVGMDAARKARRTGEAILERTRELFAEHGLADYSRTLIEVLGSSRAISAPCAHHRHARGCVAGGGDASAEGGAGAVRARDGPGRHILVAGDHRRRWPATSGAGDQAVRLPSGQGRGGAPGGRGRSGHAGCGAHGTGRGGGASACRARAFARRNRRSADRGSTDPRGLGAQRRQGGQLQHRHHRAASAMAAASARTADRGAGGRLAGAPGAGHGHALRCPRHPCHELPVHPRARWRRHGFAAQRPAGQGDGADTAVDAGAGAADWTGRL